MSVRLRLFASRTNWRYMKSRPIIGLQPVREQLRYSAMADGSFILVREDHDCYSKRYNIVVRGSSRVGTNLVAA